MPSVIKFNILYKLLLLLTWLLLLFIGNMLFPRLLWKVLLLIKSGRIGFLFQKVAQCSETYLKKIRFFSFWDRTQILKNFTKIGKKKCYPKNMRNVLKLMQNQFCRFLNCEIWLILYSKFLVNWRMRNNVRKLHTKFHWARLIMNSSNRRKMAKSIRI